jgi:hypothetical protein
MFAVKQPNGFAGHSGVPMQTFHDFQARGPNPKRPEEPGPFPPEDPVPQPPQPELPDTDPGEPRFPDPDPDPDLPDPPFPPIKTAICRAGREVASDEDGILGPDSDSFSGEESPLRSLPKFVLFPYCSRVKPGHRKISVGRATCQSICRTHGKAQAALPIL